MYNNNQYTHKSPSKSIIIMSATLVESNSARNRDIEPGQEFVLGQEFVQWIEGYSQDWIPMTEATQRSIAVHGMNATNIADHIPAMVKIFRSMWLYSYPAPQGELVRQIDKLGSSDRNFFASLLKGIEAENREEVGRLNRHLKLLDQHKVTLVQWLSRDRLVELYNQEMEHERREIKRLEEELGVMTEAGTTLIQEKERRQNLLVKTLYFDSKIRIIKVEIDYVTGQVKELLIRQVRDRNLGLLEEELLNAQETAVTKFFSGDEELL